MHKHHRKRRSQGGDDSPANIIHVSPQFHDWIHTHPARAYEDGLMVKSYDDPAAVPVVDMELHYDGWRRLWSASVPGEASETDAEGGLSDKNEDGRTAVQLRCPRCHGTGALTEPPTKAERPRQRKTLGIRLPVDADENGIEVLETLLSAARDELKETMGWKENVGVYFVIVAVLHDWLTGRVSAETA